MITATELRLGNYYLSFGVDLKQVEQLTKDKILIDFHPIPITEEWLLKFGFKQVLETSQVVMYRGNFGIEKDGDKWPCILRIQESDIFNLRTSKFYHLPNPILFVHELQNLHFTLMGEELQIKEAVTS